MHAPIPRCIEQALGANKLIENLLRYVLKKLLKLISAECLPDILFEREAKIDQHRLSCTMKGYVKFVSVADTVGFSINTYLAGDISAIGTIFGH